MGSGVACTLKHIAECTSHLCRQSQHSVPPPFITSPLQWLHIPSVRRTKWSRILLRRDLNHWPGGILRQPRFIRSSGHVQWQYGQQVLDTPRMCPGQVQCQVNTSEFWCSPAIPNKPLFMPSLKHPWNYLACPSDLKLFPCYELLYTFSVVINTES